MKTNANTYKFRAEFAHDPDTALALLPPETVIDHYSCDYDERGEPTVTIRLPEMNLRDVRQWLGQVEDGNVMTETVALQENYTGERNYKTLEEMVA